ERLAREQAGEAAHAPVVLAVGGEQGGDAADRRRLGFGPDPGDPLVPLRRVGGRDRPVRGEAGAGGGAGDLGAGRDILALAEEGLVERVLERPEPALLPRPEAGGERKGRPRLIAGEVDLDPEALGPAIDSGRPVDAEMIAPYLEQRFRGRAELERQPF